ncbi:MAG: MFS transporter [Alphaproteobacteria bacterium]|nr:MFS transporter [Alphaproteobacteria bacterium]
MTSTGMNTFRSRPLRALYVAGPFSMGYVDFYTFLIPLYALSLGFDASRLGILVGARSIVAMVLSIHIGVLMDRFGTRKVTLFFVWMGIALAPLFPLVPWFWPLLLLQLINGAAVSFAWSGAQTLIAQLAEGDPRDLGRFTFFARLGSTTVPILAGAVWDFGGAWSAYLVGAAWGGVLTIALLCAPEAEFFGPHRPDGTGRPRFHARDAWPRASDYANSILLIAIPAIALSMAIMSTRNTTYSIQTSVYVVYLKKAGLVGTMIGMLFAAAEIASGFGALFAGRAVRLGDAQRTMLGGTALSILLIAMTPLLGSAFTLLLLFQLARGWLEGVIQPLVLSVQARAVGRHQQGAVVGLRQTGQRLTSILIPPLMGGIADRYGVSESFFILGGLMLLLCLPLALIIRRLAQVRAPRCRMSVRGDRCPMDHS